jgi:hypothetical protein
MTTPAKSPRGQRWSRLRCLRPSPQPAKLHHLLTVADPQEKKDMIETTVRGGWVIEAALRPRDSRCSPGGTGAQLRYPSETWELR